jgi:hypothetical protein
VKVECKCNGTSIRFSECLRGWPVGEAAERTVIPDQLLWSAQAASCGGSARFPPQASHQLRERTSLVTSHGLRPIRLLDQPAVYDKTRPGPPASPPVTTYDASRQRQQSRCCDLAEEYALHKPLDPHRVLGPLLSTRTSPRSLLPPVTLSRTLYDPITLLVPSHPTAPPSSSPSAPVAASRRPFTPPWWSRTRQSWGPRGWRSLAACPAWP